MLPFLETLVHGTGHTSTLSSLFLPHSRVSQKPCYALFHAQLPPPSPYVFFPNPNQDFLDRSIESHPQPTLLRSKDLCVPAVSVSEAVRARPPKTDNGGGRIGVQ